MKTTAAAIIAILAALLTWFSARAFNPEAELFDQALAELSRFGMIENALLRDIFAARTGMLRNYDPLVQETESLRESLSRLRSTTSAIDAAFVPQTDQLAGAVERQEQTVEQFKTENALLQNSLAFFGRFAPQSAEPLDPAISATVAAILRLSLDTSSATADDVEARLTALDRQSKETSGPTDTVNVLLAHGRLLNELLPSVDGTLRRLRALPLKPHQDALRRAILAEQLASRTSARQFRWLLYGTSLLLVIFLGYLARRLKSRADALRRQAAFEHIITGISMRFINTTPRTLDADVDQALAELAEFIGPDRAYFVMAGPSPRLHVWHRPGNEPPPGWPAQAPELAAMIGTSADGVLRIPDVNHMPIGPYRSRCLDLGLGAWACLQRLDSHGSVVALGFDAVGRPHRIPRELPLLRMALECVVQAVERNAMETERARLEARLRHAQRMERIGVFTSGIAHNFNNILGGILGHSEVMAGHVGSDAKLVRNLHGIQRSAERARDLVEQIMLFGRRDEPNGKPLSASALVTEAASLLNVSLPAGVELMIYQPPSAAIVVGEPAQLQQVLLNLCRNAAHAMPTGGSIELTIELHELAERRTLSHGGLEAGHYVCLTVSDNGSGMDDATQARIFEPFFTTRSSGNGLGLATVREIVRRHGGALHVQSRVGEGSRFEIWLPRSFSELEVDLESAALPRGRGETVLLVAQDAEHVLRDEEMLAALGYEPVGFADADSALAACRTRPDRFDATIVGAQASTAATVALAAALHAIAPRIPVVLATRATIEIDAETLASSGIFDVVRWPIRAEEIAVALDHGISQNQARQRPSRHRSEPPHSLH
jgi:signal transduction histidine kinase